ncbi:MAG: nicotinate-nucleotide--dimethylbenzimidazole phosphoribosyltransferase [bacterium]
MSLLQETVDKITALDRSGEKEIQGELDFLTKPRGSLGRLEELALEYVLITGKKTIGKKTIVVMAGDHGVVAEGVSAFPQEVTPQMVLNFLRGGAGINVLSRHVGAEVIVVDIGVAGEIPESDLTADLNRRRIANGTDNMLKGPAMSLEQAARAVETGIMTASREIARGADLLGTGDMGIGNTTPSTAISAVITGKPVAEITGRGTGIDDSALTHKIEVIEQAIEKNRPDSNSALDILAKVGGYEIGGLAGVILAGAAARVPVVIDGFISASALLIACKLAPRAVDYIMTSHNSVESGHKVIYDYLGVSPLFDLSLRLGEGTGAALGMSLVEAGVKILSQMATFADAGVTENES